jgi:hypothetical protein
MAAPHQRRLRSHGAERIIAEESMDRLLQMEEAILRSRAPSAGCAPLQTRKRNDIRIVRLNRR